MKPQVLLLLNILLLNASALQTFYVRPLHVKFQECPGQPCLTLDQYTEKTDSYFISETTFIFMAGNHILDSAINLVNITELSLKGNGSIINYKNPIAIASKSVCNLTIEGLTFIHSWKTEQASTALVLSGCTEVWVAESSFLGNEDTLSRAIFAQHSSTTILSCNFEGNRADDGGAIYASNGTNITLDGNIFISNRAEVSGGAIYALKSCIIMEEVMGNTYIFNSAAENGGALYCEESNYSIKTSNYDPPFSKVSFNFSSVAMVNQHVTYFGNNNATNGGAVHLYNSFATLQGTALIIENNVADLAGGAIYNSGSHVIISARNSFFIRNTAYENKSDNAISNQNKNLFVGNNIPRGGGAIFALYGSLTLAGNGSYESNDAIIGGAIIIVLTHFVASGELSMSFNQAKYGGAIISNCTDLLFDKAIVKFLSNSASRVGGAIATLKSKLLSHKSRFNFINNIAFFFGGGIYSTDGTMLELASVTFINNTSTAKAGGGGAIFTQHEKNVKLHNISISGSTNSALSIAESNISISGTTIFSNNIGMMGGAILSTNSFIAFKGLTIIENNIVELSGGAISASFSKISFTGITLVSLNTAEQYGGAFYLANSDMTFGDIVNFTSNAAMLGGALCFDSGATMTLLPYTILTTSHNYAEQYGGAIYHKDEPTDIQCEYKPGWEGGIVEFTSPCFLQLKDITTASMPFSIISQEDFATIDGSFVYGGLLDRCRINIIIAATGILNRTIPYQILKNNITYIKSINATKQAVASAPYQLCFCNSENNYNCSEIDQRKVYRGQRFIVSLSALTQSSATISSLVTAKVPSTARIKLNQGMQNLTSNCTALSYNLYSTAPHEQLKLYPNGPCRDTGLATAIINVTFLPCPDGFIHQNDQCICEQRLQAYNAECKIDHAVYIKRKAGLTYWINALYVNETYQGLILYKTCPADYCTNQTVYITLDNPDIQCNSQRTGILCGACATNSSLMLGTSQCQPCSNRYLSILIAFIAAGIALIGVLTCLQLTVATGMINSIILYANMVQVNKALFIPVNHQNLLTVFIAWMNLDLGFKTCFYDGMDAYSQTWLQFAFPTYVWILICLIIVSSRYSFTVSKLIGSNPIAVLATLMLMSYAKILRIIIEVYSFVNLDYPNNQTVTVWLKDANVPYLHSKHLVLTIITSAVLAIFFLPYTLLLLVGHKLYPYSNKKYLVWIKPLLDSYYAPYRKHTHYWTGLLILVRCALYIVFSFNSLGATTKSLLAINITFTALVVLAWLSISIYKKFTTNIIEASVYLNLIVLSASTQAGANSPTLVYTLIGIVFATLIGIIVYHFHHIYTAKTVIWQKLKTKACKAIKITKNVTTRQSPPSPPPPPAGQLTGVAAKPNAVTHSVVGLREPLLEN